MIDYIKITQDRIRALEKRAAYREAWAKSFKTYTSTHKHAIECEAKRCRKRANDSKMLLQLKVGDLVSNLVENDFGIVLDIFEFNEPRIEEILGGNNRCLLSVAWLSQLSPKQEVHTCLKQIAKEDFIISLSLERLFPEGDKLREEKVYSLPTLAQIIKTVDFSPVEMNFLKQIYNQVSSQTFRVGDHCSVPHRSIKKAVIEKERVTNGFRQLETKKGLFYSHHLRIIFPCLEMDTEVISRQL